MKIDRYSFPDNLLYDEEHNWALLEGDVATIGLSDFGQDLAGEIVYAEVPRVGRTIEQGQPFMSLGVNPSVGWASGEPQFRGEARGRSGRQLGHEHLSALGVGRVVRRPCAAAVRPDGRGGAVKPADVEGRGDPLEDQPVQVSGLHRRPV